MMVLGICGCTALLITAMGLSDSIKNIISVQYDEIFHNDYTVTFDRDMREAQQEAFRERTRTISTRRCSSTRSR